MQKMSVVPLISCWKKAKTVYVTSLVKEKLITDLAQMIADMVGKPRIVNA